MELYRFDKEIEIRHFHVKCTLQSSHGLQQYQSIYGCSHILIFVQVALICSLVNGKIFMEWVSPAVLKAYQWQVSIHSLIEMS